MSDSGFDTISLRDGRLCRYHLDSDPLHHLGHAIRRSPFFPRQNPTTRKGLLHSPSSWPF
jgi:hypothetical protein